MRAQYQTIVFPYIKNKTGDVTYCIFKRRDLKFWQAISGGGEDTETLMETAKREAWEEAGISSEDKFFQLTSTASIPVEFVRGFLWGEDVLVTPEYSFGVEVKDNKITIAEEHSEYLWGTYEEVREKLEYDSNKIALWELNHRLLNGKLP